MGDSAGPLEAIEEFLTGVRPGPAPERVLATVLFTDIVDSTRLATEMATVAGATCSRSTRRWSASHLERFGGREVKTTGDGFLAVFDGPTRAVECAAPSPVTCPRSAFEVRAGLHTGEVELIGDDIGGIAVHVAARVSALAEGARPGLPRPSTTSPPAPGSRWGRGAAMPSKGVAEEWDIYEGQVHSTLTRRRVGACKVD